MEKDEILAKLAVLEKGINALAEKYREVKGRLDASEKENQQLKEEIIRQNEELKYFQNQDKISRIVSSITEDSRNSSELKLKINEYIKEIDKCIAHLSE